MPSKSSSYKSATRSTERNTNDQSFRNDPAVIEQTGRVEDATFGEDLELELEQSTAQEHDRLLQSDDEGDELTLTLVNQLMIRLPDLGSFLDCSRATPKSIRTVKS